MLPRYIAAVRRTLESKSSVISNCFVSRIVLQGCTIVLDCCLIGSCMKPGEIDDMYKEFNICDSQCETFDCPSAFLSPFLHPLWRRFLFLLPLPPQGSHRRSLFADQPPQQSLSPRHTAQGYQIVNVSNLSERIRF